MEEKEACDIILNLRSLWFTDWTEWSSCSQACGNGTQSRSRVSKNNSQLVEDLECFENKPCNLGPCPINCKLSPWKPVSHCAGDCSGSGYRPMVRNITEPAEYGGRCDYELEKQEWCRIYFTPWSSWTVCDAECDVGKKSRSRESEFGQKFQCEDKQKCKIKNCPPVGGKDNKVDF